VIKQERKRKERVCLLWAVSSNVRVKSPCFFLLRVVCVATVCCLPPRDECVFCFRCVSIHRRGARSRATSSPSNTITILIVCDFSKET
jgi:hypothetical protein